jgi:hypothetical protein
MGVEVPFQMQFFDPFLWTYRDVDKYNQTAVIII